MNEQYLETLHLLTSGFDGILSTISVDVDGYPFGSITPYCLDRSFYPNILISDIAQHTKNIKMNSKVSLTVVESNQETKKQAQGRVTFVGDAKLVRDSEDVRQRYLRRFPSAEGYFETHDFNFYQIVPKRIRYIGGFGKIFWIESQEFETTNFFDAKTETMILDHMNKDHRQNLVDYGVHFLGLSGSAQIVAMVGIDQYGIDLLVEDKPHRIPFRKPLTSTSEARAELVTMAKQARGES